MHLFLQYFKIQDGYVFLYRLYYGRPLVTTGLVLYNISDRVYPIVSPFQLVDCHVPDDPAGGYLPLHDLSVYMRSYAGDPHSLEYTGLRRCAR